MEEDVIRESNGTYRRLQCGVAKEGGESTVFEEGEEGNNGIGRVK
jgi:hypothetical protein